MLARLRYIFPVVVLLGFGGWVYSDDLPKPNLMGAVQNLQQTLLQLQKQIKDLQSSVKELAKDAKDAQKQKAARVSAPSLPPRRLRRRPRRYCRGNPGAELAKGPGCIRARPTCGRSEVLRAGHRGVYRNHRA